MKEENGSHPSFLEGGGGRVDTLVHLFNKKFIDFQTKPMIKGHKESEFGVSNAQYFA